jgi:hypothetical protein
MTGFYHSPPCIFLTVASCPHCWIFDVNFPTFPYPYICGHIASVCLRNKSFTMISLGFNSPFIYLKLRFKSTFIFAFRYGYIIELGSNLFVHIPDGSYICTPVEAGHYTPRQLSPEKLFERTQLTYESAARISYLKLAYV